MQVNGYTAVALTKLDILDGFSEIKIGVEYLKDGKVIDYFPSSEQVRILNGEAASLNAYKLQVFSSKCYVCE